jgi:hypothetical protein
MKTAKKALILALILTVSLTCFCMERPTELTTQTSPATSRAIFSLQENIFKDLQKDMESGDIKFIFFDTLVFTNQNLGNALKKAHENDTHIEGTLGTHHSNKNMEAFFDENNIDVQKKSQNHLKRFLISEKDPRFGSPGKCIVYEGSANPTNYAYNNFETLIQTKNDKPFFMEHFKNHTNVMNDVTNSPSKKKLVECTPEKGKHAFGSQEYKLNQSKALRIQKLANSTNTQRSLYITSMNWDSLDITQAVIDAQKSGVSIKVILNKSALEGKGKEQLAQMDAAGVPIYIYDAGEKNRTIQHTKVIVRIDGSSYLVIHPTGNITPEGDKEHNTDSYYTESEELAKDIVKALDTIIASPKCKPYAQAIATLSEKKESSKKRLFEDSKENVDKESTKKLRGK